MKVPQEIDDLMWRLAEESHPVAQAEFEARHARYGPELARRIRMVAELRQAGKAVVHRPAFVPRPSQVAPARHGAIGAALGLAVLAVGAVAYVAASGGERPTPPVVAPTPRTIPAEPVPLVSPPPKKVEPETPPVVVRTDPQPKHEEKPKEAVPTDIRVKDTDLSAAIQLVARVGKLDVTLAPGFPDRKVTFDYGTMTPLETLKTMGEENGFSVIDEGEGQILVVPAREAPSDRRIGT